MFVSYLIENLRPEKYSTATNYIPELSQICLKNSIRCFNRAHNNLWRFPPMKKLPSTKGSQRSAQLPLWQSNSSWEAIVKSVWYHEIHGFLNSKCAVCYPGALNEIWAYEWGKRKSNTGESAKSGTVFFNGRVVRCSNVSIKALDVLYKSIGAFIF